MWQSEGVTRTTGALGSAGKFLSASVTGPLGALQRLVPKNMKLPIPLALSVLLTLGITVALVVRGSHPGSFTFKQVPSLPADKLYDAGSIVPGARVMTAQSLRELRYQLTCMPHDGHWELDGTPRPLPWNDPHIDTCDQQWVQHGDGSVAGTPVDGVKDPATWRVREGLKYRWKLHPTKCTADWREFDQEKFCSSLDTHGGNMLIVGGPTAHTMFQSVHNHLSMGRRLAGQKSPLLVTPEPCKDWEDEGKLPEGGQSCRAIWSCKGPEHGTYIFYARNDRLTVSEEGPEKNEWGVFLPWLELIPKWHIRTLILSRGEPFPGNRLLEKQLRETLAAVRSRYPHVLILYRSATLRHVDCTEHAVPYNSISDLKSHRQHQLQTRNMVARGVVEEHGGVFLDVEHLSALRPDGHVGFVEGANETDCLDYCNPGPVDAWVQLLHNTLMLLTELDPP